MSSAALVGFGILVVIFILIVILRLLANAVREVTVWERRNGYNDAVPRKTHGRRPRL